MAIKDTLIKRIMRHMNWTEEKALLWYNTDNPHFGNASPRRMVEMGRGHKVLSFVDAAEDEDSEPDYNYGHE